MKKTAGVDWARTTAARYGDPEVLRACIDEQKRLEEREKTRPARTPSFWTNLLGCLQLKVSAFNTEWREELIKCTKGRDRFVISLPPSKPYPPHDVFTEVVSLTLRFDRKLSLIRVVHSDEPCFMFALQPHLKGIRGRAEIVVLIEKVLAIPIAIVTLEEASQRIIECLLRMPCEICPIVGKYDKQAICNHRNLRPAAR